MSVSQGLGNEINKIKADFVKERDNLLSKVATLDTGLTKAKSDLVAQISRSQTLSKDLNKAKSDLQSQVATSQSLRNDLNKAKAEMNSMALELSRANQLIKTINGQLSGLLTKPLGMLLTHGINKNK